MTFVQHELYSTLYLTEFQYEYNPLAVRQAMVTNERTIKIHLCLELQRFTLLHKSLKCNFQILQVGFVKRLQI